MQKSWKLEKMEPFLENLFLSGGFFQDQCWFCFGKLRPCDLPFAMTAALCGWGTLLWSTCQGPWRQTFPCLLSGHLILEGLGVSHLAPSPHQPPIFFMGNLRSFALNLLHMKSCSSAEPNILWQPLSIERVFSGFVSKSVA